MGTHVQHEDIPVQHVRCFRPTLLTIHKVQKKGYCILLFTLQYKEKENSSNMILKNHGSTLTIFVPYTSDANNYFAELGPIAVRDAGDGHIRNHQQEHYQV